MESDPEGKPVAHSRKTMSDYGYRAARALERLVPGPNRDKRVARMFNCSVRQAGYLRRGDFWTIDRLSEASRLLGAAFDRYLAQPDFNQRLDELETDLAELRRQLTEGGRD